MSSKTSSKAREPKRGTGSPFRLACVNVPQLTLQILRRRHPEWLGRAVAVVAEDKPTATVLAVNKRARSSGIRPGQRYSVALGRLPELRARAVPQSLVTETVEELLNVLYCFSPEIEPASATPGVFWVNASGLERLYPDLKDWADALRQALKEKGFTASVTVGYSRFGTYAVARNDPGTVIFDSPRQERNRAEQTPLDMEPLEKLGVHRVKDLLKLPATGLKERFGKEAYQLQQKARTGWDPLQPRPEVVPLASNLAMEFPEACSQRLLYILKKLLNPLLHALHQRGQAADRLELALELEDGSRTVEVLRTAQPTLDEACLLELARLRLETLELKTGVVDLTVSVAGEPATREQLELFQSARRRNLEAANRALARLVAEFGEESVVRARLSEGHLPQATFEWEPLHQLKSPKPASTEHLTAIRRLYDHPSKLRPPRIQHGPYRISGGWWQRRVSRDYYFAEGGLWVYYDRIRQCWFLEGVLA